MKNKENASNIESYIDRAGEILLNEPESMVWRSLIQILLVICLIYACLMLMYGSAVCKTEPGFFSDSNRLNTGLLFRTK